MNRALQEDSHTVPVNVGATERDGSCADQDLMLPYLNLKGPRN